MLPQEVSVGWASVGLGGFLTGQPVPHVRVEGTQAVAVPNAAPLACGRHIHTGVKDHTMPVYTHTLGTDEQHPKRFLVVLRQDSGQCPSDAFEEGSLPNVSLSHWLCLNS